jgi:hypothetical protein
MAAFEEAAALDAASIKVQVWRLTRFRVFLFRDLGS